MTKLLNITSDVDGLSIGSDISAESGIVKSSLPLSLLCGRHITSGITTQLMGTMAGSDFWRLAGGATASDSGYLEIATADNGNEPIYVRQYTGKFTGNSRTLTLLDANGNTEIPGSTVIGDSLKVKGGDWPLVDISTGQDSTSQGAELFLRGADYGWILNYNGNDRQFRLIERYQAANTTRVFANHERILVSGLETMCNASNFMRGVQEAYSTIFRNDGGTFHILMTNKNDKYGTWNDLRPFSVNCASGAVTIGNGATIRNKLTVSGGAEMSGGIILNGGGTVNSGLTSNNGGKLSGNYKIAPVASSWINGIKNNVTSAPTFWHTTQNTSSYFPFLGTKCANGDFLSFGTINNQIGFYYCKAARTDNANDGGIWYDTGNGTFYVNGVAGGVACSTAAPSGGFRGELWIQY